LTLPYTIVWLHLAHEKKSNKSGQRLSRVQWLENALEVLAQNGQAGLRIQGLADALGVSRGSFYWHFRDRDDFIRAILAYWHEVYTAPVPDLVEAQGGSAEERLLWIIRLVYEKDETRYDLPIRSWAIQDPMVAKMVRRTDRYRLTYIRRLFTEMGFSGLELEIRTRTCLAYMTLEKGLFDRLTSKQRKEHIDALHKFFVRK
jgi:AcrR family transcriptional regulator